MNRIIILLVAIAVSLPALAQKMTKNTKISGKSYVIKLNKAIKGERKIKTGMLTWQCKGSLCKATTNKFSKSYCTQAKSQVGSYSYCGTEAGLNTGPTRPPTTQPAFTPVSITTPKISVIGPAPFQPKMITTPKIRVIAKTSN